MTGWGWMMIGCKQREEVNSLEIERMKAQLEGVRAAIAAIEGGAQEYQINNRRLVKADLSTLYARESALEAKIAKYEGNDIYFAELGRL